ncbi:PQQ-dependent sugar dehydrogenase [Sphingorhabdus sp. Alg239-R122]|uniref:PQQ-dependent sugar dehydrogenase n=1 Tax=Sphingorhabdus sp. Alg239-R122 TaxID=2305989 RepID=UPI0013DACECF|nr:PQQ-dependent sugar dehydrogenase [Sphingorhabdus sp. Alg239-R122]
MHRIAITATLSFSLIACTASNGNAVSAENDDAQTSVISPVDGLAFVKNEMGTFDEPWAIAFIGNDLLVTEKAGKLFYLQLDNTGAVESKIEISGVPEVDYGGQGGFGDVVPAPDFAQSGKIYLSWIEAGQNDTRGAVVGIADLKFNDAHEGRLENMEIVWKQYPKVTGRGHYSHRIAFSPDGKYMYIGSGERQKFDPSQDMKANLGKIVRLYPDGSVPEDNPFYDQGGVTAQIWSLGHRNILGMAFDSEGRLWNQEMGPQDGDELNLVKKGENYGYPIVSEGIHYDGRDIPNHDTRPEFTAPKIAWVPTIAPGGLIFYTGDKFPAWKGSAFIGGLRSEALIRVSFDGENAKEAERFDMGARIREAEQSPDGNIWIVEDGENAKLYKLTPAK